MRNRKKLVKKIRKLKETLSDKAIGRRLGLSKDQVFRLRKKHNIPKRVPQTAGRIRRPKVKIPYEKLQSKYEMFGNSCWICGKNDEKLTSDHVKPLSKGGSNWLCNLRPACARCNSTKDNKWREKNESLSQFLLRIKLKILNDIQI